MDLLLPALCLLALQPAMFQCRSMATNATYLASSLSVSDYDSWEEGLPERDDRLTRTRNKIAELLLPILEGSYSKEHGSLRPKKIIQVLPINESKDSSISWPHLNKKHVVQITPLKTKGHSGKPLAYIVSPAKTGFRHNYDKDTNRRKSYPDYNEHKVHLVQKKLTKDLKDPITEELLSKEIDYVSNNNEKQNGKAITLSSDHNNTEQETRESLSDTSSGEGSVSYELEVSLNPTTTSSYESDNTTLYKSPENVYESDSKKQNLDDISESRGRITSIGDNSSHEDSKNTTSKDPSKEISDSRSSLETMNIYSSDISDNGDININPNGIYLSETSDANKEQHNDNIDGNEYDQIIPENKDEISIKVKKYDINRNDNVQSDYDDKIKAKVKFNKTNKNIENDMEQHDFNKLNKDHSVENIIESNMKEEKSVSNKKSELKHISDILQSKPELHDKLKTTDKSAEKYPSTSTVNYIIKRVNKRLLQKKMLDLKPLSSETTEIDDPFIQICDSQARHKADEPMHQHYSYKISFIFNK